MKLINITAMCYNTKNNNEFGAALKRELSNKYLRLIEGDKHYLLLYVDAQAKHIKRHL